MAVDDRVQEERVVEVPGERVHVWPHLVQIEFIGALVYLLALIVVSIVFKAPLLEHSNPEVTPNPSKAPWYFLGLQELLLHMHPALAGVVVPTAILILLGAIPYIDSSRVGTGIWFSTPKGLPIAIFSWIYTTIWNLGLILVDEFLPAGPGAHGIGAYLKMHGAPAAFAEVFVPCVFMVFIPWSLVVIVKRKWNANTREVMIALYSFFIISFFVLSIIGTAFRGESMRLMWPWQITHGGH